MKTADSQKFLEIVKTLNQEELSNLIDYAIELKKEELKQSKRTNC